MIYFIKFAFLAAIVHLSLGQECGLPKDFVLNSYLNKSEPVKVDPSSMPFHAKITVGTKSCHGYFTNLHDNQLKESEVLTTPACVPSNTNPATVRVNDVVAKSVQVNNITQNLVHIKLGPTSSINQEQLPCPYMPDEEVLPQESSCLIIEATSNGLTAKHAEFFEDCDDSFLEGDKDAFVKTCVRDKNSSTSAFHLRYSRMSNGKDQSFCPNELSDDTLSSIICRENGRWYLTHLKDRQTNGFALYMDLGYAMHGSLL